MLGSNEKSGSVPVFPIVHERRELLGSGVESAAGVPIQTSMSREWLLRIGLVCLSLLISGCRESRVPAERELVVMIVLDTIRSDHLSMCGYDRPTAPILEGLAREAQAVTCDAYAPGTWTLPSHASYFTGVSVPEHGAHFGPDGRRMLWDVTVHPLDERRPTLAEQLAQAGYRSVAVSANPVISEETGLVRGFDVVRRARRFGELYGQEYTEALREVLEANRDAGRLFLFLNIADAHHPWPAIPQEVDWLPTRDGMSYGIKQANSPWRRYMAGELDREAAEELRARNTDLYDWGIRRADQTLGSSLDLLRQTGWMDGAHRIVITSDHGEFLGQHGLMGHCCYPYEAVTRVPLLVLSDRPIPALPQPVSATQVFHLTRDGSPSTRASSITSAGYPSPNMIEHVGNLGHELAVASWSGHEKLMWIEGRLTRYALGDDPDEQRPLQALASDRGAIDAFAALARSSQDRTAPPDAELVQHLEALGYVE
jgi:hypothetical protein